MNPTSGLETSISSRLQGYQEHPKCCKAHSCTQERLPAENYDGHEEPESRKAFQAMASAREAASTAARALHHLRPSVPPAIPQGHRHLHLSTHQPCMVQGAPCPVQALLSPLSCGIFCAARRAHGRAEAWPPIFVISWRLLFPCAM